MENEQIDFSYFQILIPVLQKYEPVVNENDLYYPDTNLYIAIIVALLEHMGMNVQEILTIQEEENKIFEINSCFNGNCLKYINLLIFIKYLFELLEINEFMVMEIFRPRQPRVSEILCNLIVFLQHKEENEDIIGVRMKEILGRGEKAEILEEEINKLDEVISEKEVEHTAIKELYDEKLKKINNLDSVISSIKRDIDSQKVAYDNQRKINMELGTKKDQLQNDNEDLQNELDLLNRSIIQFPQRVIEDAEKSNQKLNSINDQINTVNQELKESTDKLEDCRVSFEVAETCQILIDSLSEDFDKIQTIKEEAVALKQMNDDVETTMENYRNEIQYNQEQLQIKHMSINRLESELEAKRGEAKKKLENIKNDQQEQFEEIDELRNLLKDLDEKCLLLQNETERYGTDVGDDVGIYNYVCEISSAIHSFATTINN